MDMDTSKRTRPTPSQASSVKRAKTEHCDVKLGSPSPLPLSTPQGVERIRLPASVHVNRLSPPYLEQLASERTEMLRGQGRLVVGLPVVLDDGIVLNWVHHRSSSREADVTPLVVRQTATSGYKNEDHLPPVSISDGSGTSSADAIIISLDEDITRVSSPSLTLKPRGLSVNLSSVLTRDVIDSSGIEPFTPAHSEKKTEDNQEPSPHPPYLPLTRESSYPEDVAERMSASAPTTRALTRDAAAEASRLYSDDTSMSISDSEVDGTDGVVSDVEDIGGRKMFAQHTKPLSFSSSQPVRGLLVRRRRQGGLYHDVLPVETIVIPQVSRKQGRKELPKVAPTSASSKEGSDLQALSDPQLKRVPLPKTIHGRARRLLVPHSADLPLVAVTMRGDCHFIKRKEKYRITGYSLPNPGVFRHVADVCMVGNTAVLGYDKGTDQISFLSVVGKPQMINVTCSPHSSGPRYQDIQKRGVSCLAAIHAKGGHIKFLSGGYDGTVHEWMADVERLDEPRSNKVVSHGARIMALAYRDRDRSVVASAQKRLHTTDLNRDKTTVYPFSNDIQQIHIHPQAAYVTLLEVRHLDHQIQLYDSRKANFDSEPCLAFGCRNTNSKFPATHTRGSVHLVHFAKASEDGCVLLWDFRNSKKAVVERRFRQAEKVVHTVFADRDIATFGQDVVTFFEDYLA